MREILFRGKAENKEWVYGWYVGYSIATGYIYSDYVDNNEIWQVDNNTVGQYTGLVDKNGVKIFEGDIVEAWSQGVKARGEVKQRIDGYWLMYPAYQSGKSWALVIDGIKGTTEIEVIGNIHDNPELLKENKNA